MFSKEYQGGTYVDVFSAQGRDPAAHWRLTGSVRKEFDKSIRGYAYVLEGGVSTTTTRMQMPKSDKTSLGLTQPCCVFQLLVPEPAKFTIDLTVLDQSGGRKRINLSSSQRELSATPLNARVPLGDLITAKWLDFCVDVAALVDLLFKGSKFKSLDRISLGGSCRLRRIFTLQIAPKSTEETYFAAIPRSFHISSLEFQSQIVSPGLWKGLDSASTSLPHSNSDQRPTHVAFGKKVAIPDHILTSRQSAERTSAGKPIARLVQPHPPTAPADQAILKIQRSRVRSVRAKPSASTVSEKSGPELDPQTNEANLTDNSILSKDEHLIVKILQSSRTESKEQTVFSYRSTPKSAERHRFSLSSSPERTSRGARLEEDFQPQAASPDNPQLDSTRLSDDYDWRQYVSAEDKDHSAEESLRTRLASHLKTSAPNHSNTPPPTSALEDTLSGSLTLSGLAEHLGDVPHTSLLDSMETRTMGGILSPALLDTGHQDLEHHRKESDYEEVDNDHPGHPDEIELMYDPQLNCFYDPVTCKYYELAKPDRS